MEPETSNIKSCVTIALVPEITYGPWIYWEDLEEGLRKAAELGFDAVELFTASADAVDADFLSQLVQKYEMPIGAVGTGAGKVLNGWNLIDPDESIRARAVEFIGHMIDFGARFKAPAIIGSMQGNVVDGVERETALGWLADGLNTLGKRAGDQGVKLIYEPLNRYETNLFNRTGDAAAFLKTLDTKDVTLLTDLFHMNIEEASIGDALRENAEYVGHVHFADSNRRPIGLGHTDMTDIVAALKEINYTGYASAEAFPYPDPDEAAAQTMEAFNECFRPK